jgi:hypothetical protein
VVVKVVETSSTGSAETARSVVRWLASVPVKVVLMSWPGGTEIVRNATRLLGSVGVKVLPQRTSQVMVIASNVPRIRRTVNVGTPRCGNLGTVLSAPETKSCVAVRTRRGKGSGLMETAGNV